MQCPSMATPRLASIKVASLKPCPIEELTLQRLCSFNIGRPESQEYNLIHKLLVHDWEPEATAELDLVMRKISCYRCETCKKNVV